MNKTYYDIIVLTIAAIVAGVYIYSASKEVNKSMRELNEHNRAKKSGQKYSVRALQNEEIET